MILDSMSYIRFSIKGEKPLMAVLYFFAATVISMMVVLSSCKADLGENVLSKERARERYRRDTDADWDLPNTLFNVNEYEPESNRTTLVPWNRGIIYYDFAPTMQDQSIIDLIKQAMREWETKTSGVVSFVPFAEAPNTIPKWYRLRFTNYSLINRNVALTKYDSPSSYPGATVRESGGNITYYLTLVSIPPYNAPRSEHYSGTYQTILHEIGHAIGLAHEHQRPKRNDYLIFPEIASKLFKLELEASPNAHPSADPLQSNRLQNIKLKDILNPNVSYAGKEYDPLPYDYGSIMHYNSLQYFEEGFEILRNRRNRLLDNIGHQSLASQLIREKGLFHFIKKSDHSLVTEAQNQISEKDIHLVRHLYPHQVVIMNESNHPLWIMSVPERGNNYYEAKPLEKGSKIAHHLANTNHDLTNNYKMLLKIPPPMDSYTGTISYVSLNGDRTADDLLFYSRSDGGIDVYYYPHWYVSYPLIEDFNKRDVAPKIIIDGGKFEDYITDANGEAFLAVLNLQKSGNEFRITITEKQEAVKAPQELPSINQVIPRYIELKKREIDLNHFEKVVEDLRVKSMSYFQCGGQKATEPCSSLSDQKREILTNIESIRNTVDGQRAMSKKLDTDLSDLTKMVEDYYQKDTQKILFEMSKPVIKSMVDYLLRVSPPLFGLPGEGGAKTPTPDEILTYIKKIWAVTDMGKTLSKNLNNDFDEFQLYTTMIKQNPSNPVFGIKREMTRVFENIKRDMKELDDVVSPFKIVEYSLNKTTTIVAATRILNNIKQDVKNLDNDNALAASPSATSITFSPEIVGKDENQLPPGVDNNDQLPSDVENMSIPEE